MTVEWFDVSVLSTHDDVVTELVYKNRVYRYVRDLKLIRPHLVKWLKTKALGYEFTLQMFFNAYPKQKSYRIVNEHYISRLIDERRIIQISNTSFKLIAY